MSSHREAPEISKDPVADSTDVYAFVSPDAPETVTLIANYLPLEGPAAGPNFYEFGTDVQYEVHVSNSDNSMTDITYVFNFEVTVVDPNTFLYNTGPIANSGTMKKPVYENWNRVQTYSLTKLVNGKATVIANKLPCPPCNIGPLSTPNYQTLQSAAVQTLTDPTTGHALKVYAGQRAEGFYVDLGAIFDLADIRPFQNYNVFGNLTAMPSVNATDTLNVHTLALQIPIGDLTSDGSVPTHVEDPRAVLGIHTSAWRRKVKILEPQAVLSGPLVQVSRLGNPLFNEVLIPMPLKDFWNSQDPDNDAQFAQYADNPEISQLLPVIYKQLFPNLGAYNAAHPSGDRADIVAILLTGLPQGIVKGFQNYTGTTQADLLRLNVAVPPTSSPSNLGILGGDLAGFPNGRRVFDDVVSIELKALAGATLPLVDPSYTPDAAVGELTQGLTSGPDDTTADGTEHYLSSFPYLGVAHSGYNQYTTHARQAG